MLTQLRESAQSWIIKALLGLIVVTFVISFGVGTFQNPKEVLVTIDGDEIMVSQFLTRYQQELENLRKRFPDNADELAAQINLREQVMRDLINRRLILKAADEEGIEVVEEEVQAAVTQQEAFKINNRFDFNTYQQILRQNRLTPVDYEARLSEDLLVNKLQRSLLAGLILNEQDVSQRYAIEQERVEVDYLFVDPARFAPEKPVSEEDAKAYYEKHPDQFIQSERFKLRYFVLPLSAVESGQSVHPRAVERYYQRNVDTEFSTPKKVRASHILKRLPQNASPDDEAKLRAEMEALAERARKGEDFTKLAKQYSEDFTKDKGGDLGFFTREDMVPAFAIAAFATPKGQISGPVRSPFGFHLIKVTDIQEGVRKTLEEVRKSIEAKLISLQAERRLDLEVQRLPGRIEKEGLDKVAAEFKAKPGETGMLDGIGLDKGLGSVGPLYLQLKGKRKGHVGVWQRNPVIGHVFYEVADWQAAHTKPFEDVRKEATARAVRERQQELALAEAKQVLQQWKTPKDFDAYSKRRELKVNTVGFTVVDATIEGIGPNHEFQRSAFRLSAEKPFAINIQDGKAYLMRFKRRYYAEPDKEQALKEQIRNRMRAELAQHITQNEVERLRSQVKIDVLAPEYLYSGSSTPPAR